MCQYEFSIISKIMCMWRIFCRTNCRLHLASDFQYNEAHLTWLMKFVNKQNQYQKSPKDYELYIAAGVCGFLTFSLLQKIIHLLIKSLVGCWGCKRVNISKWSLVISRSTIWLCQGSFLRCTTAVGRCHQYYTSEKIMGLHV